MLRLYDRNGNSPIEFPNIVISLAWREGGREAEREVGKKEGGTPANYLSGKSTCRAHFAPSHTIEAILPEHAPERVGLPRE